MPLLDLDFYLKNKFWLGLFALIVSVLAWSVELSGLVYICPYCRVQRTVIGLLGVVLMSPLTKHWLGQFFAIVIGFFGAVVAANQHFMGWKKISAGSFSFKENLAIDPFILSGLAMIFILFQLFIISRSTAD
ncbi:hypothetical protein [Thalassotalea euphylliae]|uniref:Disulfide bond formation protein B n=1 Tax=Thalassotalea euphylliae TaxID=1655234 RepID=A0A3E0UGS1_9GAMM|nr:hypothetical protein [Thalassotalea euphylliae]REL36056.1 hypothetical protein DXX92_12410 [Thalassotalea euphylliae]